jgi:hypothetical protein
MNHSQKIFTFISKSGEAVECKTKPYSENLEKKFISIIGKDVWAKYQSTGVFEFDVTADKAKKDFPELLDGDLSQAAWEDTDLYELAGVYFFFVTFRKNVFTKLQAQLNEADVSLMVQYLQTLNLIPQDILKNLPFRSEPFS